jgi:DNA-binding beta-propeller fold protein YncE
MSETEQRLTDALHVVAGSVPDEALRPLTAPAPAPGNRAASLGPTATMRSALGSALGGRQARWLAPSAAAVAILLVVGAAAAVPHLLHSKPVSSSTGSAVAPTVAVGGFPTGVAYDAGSGTIYVSGGAVNQLTMINARTCNADVHSGCRATKRVSTDGQDPIGVAVDEATHTVYTVNGSSNTVAVINAATCNAFDSSGCTARPPLIKVAGGPEFLAVDQATDTIYVASTNSGTVAVINGATCNASDTSGCRKAPVTARAGGGAFPIAVDAATNTVYVGLRNSVAVIDGATCNAADTAGCAHAPALISAGAPAGIAVDDANRTVYISGEYGKVTVVSRDTCDAADTAGCGGRHATVAIGSDPRGNALVGAAGTLYATNAASDTVSMINTRTCDAASTAGCATRARAFPAGLSPRRIAVDPVTGTVYVVNTGASTISMIDYRTCGATRSSGCPTKSPAGTSNTGTVSGGGSGGGGAMTSYCRPLVTPSTSGQPAASFTSKATELASGSVAGQAWSVWAKKGVAEPYALEDGGLVLNGRWYGLCTGMPNVFEMELLNTGSTGIDYGYVAFSGKAEVKLADGADILPSPQDVALKDASFFIGSLPKSACAYRQLLTHARTSADSSMHQLGFGSCEPGRVVAITGSDGEWGQGQSQWSQPGMGLATPERSGLSGSAGSPVPSSSAGGLANTQDECSAGPTNADSGRPAAAMTRSAVRVAAGTTGGLPWSLWASTGSAGVVSIEQGGLVVNGRWYGMCPGAPNPAEFELLNAGHVGLVYGYVANPGAYSVRLSGSIPAPRALQVRGGTFFVGQLPRSACAYRTVILNATSKSINDMHQLDFGGSCRSGQLAAVTGGQGAW